MDPTGLVAREDLLLCEDVTKIVNDEAYGSNAIVPAGDWRELSPHELQAIFRPRTETKYWQLVGKRQLKSTTADKLMRAVGERKETERSTPDTRNLAADALSILLRETDTHLSFEDDLTFIGFREAAVDGPTQTVDYFADMKKPGLHLDTWDETSSENRYLSRNRICINLGNVDRYFIFLPITVEGFRRKLPMSSRLGSNEAAKKYLATGPDMPVIAIRVKPNEFYFAPTENLIHDGWCPDVSAVDRTFTILGRFIPR